MFKRCVPETLPATEQGLNDESLSIVNCRRREKLFEVTTLAAVSNIIEQNYHCVLDINPDALERLHRVQIYPVVIFIKFKHSKQIK